MRRPRITGKLVAATYNAAKTADPGCQVGLAAQSNNVNYLEQAIKAGAADHFDYVTLHPYEILGGVNSGEEAVYMSIVPTMRKMLAARDPRRANAPVWFTELGTEINDKITPELQGETLVKGYTMGIAQGENRGPPMVRVHGWRQRQNGHAGAGRQIPRPAYTAMAQMIKYFGPHPAYLGWVLINNKDYGFVFKGAASTILATWAPPGAADNVNFGQPVQIVNPLTVTSPKRRTTR